MRRKSVYVLEVNSISHTKIRAVAGKSRDLSLGISGLLGSKQAILSYPDW